MMICGRIFYMSFWTCKRNAWTYWQNIFWRTWTSRTHLSPLPWRGGECVSTDTWSSPCLWRCHVCESGDTLDKGCLERGTCRTAHLGSPTATGGEALYARDEQDRQGSRPAIPWTGWLPWFGVPWPGTSACYISWWRCSPPDGVTSSLPIWADKVPWLAEGKNFHSAT